MCSHRVATRWGRIWDTFTALVLGGFVVLETYGLVTEGSDATYSHNWQTKVGAVTPCRHTWIGRTAIVAFFAWAAAHLGWGKFGLGDRRARRSSTATRSDA